MSKTYNVSEEIKVLKESGKNLRIAFWLLLGYVGLFTGLVWVSIDSLWGAII